MRLPQTTLVVVALASLWLAEPSLGAATDGSLTGEITVMKGTTKLNGRATVVPDGGYRIKLRALRALGDPGNEAHWDTWTSPVVTLDRP